MSRRCLYISLFWFWFETFLTCSWDKFLLSFPSRLYIKRGAENMWSDEQLSFYLQMKYVNIEFDRHLIKLCSLGIGSMFLVKFGGTLIVLTMLNLFSNHLVFYSWFKNMMKIADMIMCPFSLTRKWSISLHLYSHIIILKLSSVFIHA